jgi:hypothetical protein
MNLSMLVQGILFIAEGLWLVLALSFALEFKIARLLFVMAVAAMFLALEVFLVVKVARRLWGWSGRLAAAIVPYRSAKVVSLAPADRHRGEP